MTNKEKAELVDKALATLSEHIEVVQISCWWHKGPLVHEMHRGSGNYLIRQQIAETFCWRDHDREVSKETIGIQTCSKIDALYEPTRSDQGLE